MGHLCVSMFLLISSVSSKWQFAKMSQREQRPAVTINLEWKNNFLDMKTDYCQKNSGTSLPSFKEVLKMNSFKTVTISFSSFTKWGPKTIKTNITENLEQCLGALMITLTTKKPNNQWHSHSEVNVIEQYTKSKKDWRNFKGKMWMWISWFITII